MLRRYFHSTATLSFTPAEGHKEDQLTDRGPAFYALACLGLLNATMFPTATQYSVNLCDTG